MKIKLNYFESIHYIMKVWNLAKIKKVFLVLYIVCSLSLAGLGIIIPVYSAKIISSISTGSVKPLLIAGLTIFIIGVIRDIFNFISSRTMNIVNRASVDNIQKTLAKKTLNLKMNIVDNYASGILIERLGKDSRDLARIFNWINKDSMTVITNLGILVAIFIINKTFFFISIATIFVLFFLQRAKAEKLIVIEKSLKEQNEKNSSILSEAVRGLRDVRVLHIERNFLELLNINIAKGNTENMHYSFTASAYSFWINIMHGICNFIFIIAGILLLNNNDITPASLLIIYMYQFRIQNLIYFIDDLIDQTKKFNLAAERVFELIDDEFFPKEEFGNTNLNDFNHTISFNNVNFGYKEDLSILKNVSFNINKNQTIALVGKSGSGKSTIASLLTKMYDTYTGEILIDGIDIKNLKKTSLRSLISMVNQSPYIFNLSIKENLKLIKPNLTHEEMISICKITHLYDFIEELPEKYDTVIGEGGVTLSGGQRQRLAIARALLKGSPIILFDEATSALDNETQASISDAISKMKGNYTILIIAHRLSTVIDSDQIIFMDKGKIIDQGTHQELLKKNTIYQKLYAKELK